MSATTVLPNPKDVRDMLEGLLGRDVNVSPSNPPETDKPLAIGVYVDDTLTMQALGVADLPFAAFSGAAIGLIPKGGAEACVEDNELSASVKENFGEVLNVVSALFNLPEHPHLKLYGTYAPGEAPPGDVSAAARVLGRRLDLEAEVAGYGKGIFSLVLT